MKSNLRLILFVLMLMCALLCPQTTHAESLVEKLTYESMDTRHVPNMLEIVTELEATEDLREKIDSLHQSIIDRGYEYLITEGYASRRASVAHDALERLLEELKSVDQEIDRLIAEENARVERERRRAELLDAGQAIANTASWTPASPPSYCAAWISSIYSNAGYPYISMNADDMYWAYCSSSDREEIIPGMIIAVPSHTHTKMGGIYGHVGIIVSIDGNLYVKHSSSGRVLTWTLDEWISYYDTTYTPQWGFAADVLRR